MKLQSIRWVALAAFTTLSSPAQPTEAALDQALAAAHRSEANKARDAARHPKETLLFFGLRADQKVIELSPGGGWYTVGGRVRAGRALRGQRQPERHARAPERGVVAAAHAAWRRGRSGEVPCDRGV